MSKGGSVPRKPRDSPRILAEGVILATSSTDSELRVDSVKYKGFYSASSPHIQNNITAPFYAWVPQAINAQFYPVQGTSPSRDYVPLCPSGEVFLGCLTALRSPARPPICSLPVVTTPIGTRRPACQSFCVVLLCQSGCFLALSPAGPPMQGLRIHLRVGFRMLPQ